MAETIEISTKEGHYTVVVIHPDGHKSACRVPDGGQGSVEAIQTAVESIIKLEETREGE